MSRNRLIPFWAAALVAFVFPSDALAQAVLIDAGDIVNVYGPTTVGPNPLDGAAVLLDREFVEKSVIPTDLFATAHVGDVEAASHESVVVAINEGLGPNADSTILRLNPLTGEATPILELLGTMVGSFAIHPNDNLYLSRTTKITATMTLSSLTEISATGDVRDVAPLAVPSHVAVDVDGRILVIDPSGLVAISIATGSRSIVNDLSTLTGLGLAPSHVVSRADGRLFIAAPGIGACNPSTCPYGDLSVWEISRSDNTAGLIATFGPTLNMFPQYHPPIFMDMEGDPATGDLILSSQPGSFCIQLCGGGWQLIRLDPGTGASSSGLASPNGRWTNAIAVMPALPDGDGDTIPDRVDNCIGVPNPSQADADGNGTGDACNDGEDADGDDWADLLDNCPAMANAGQQNRDADDFGDACDLCPDYPAAANADFDHNGIGDLCECGDQTQDGTVNVIDLVSINLAIFGAVQVSPLCDTNFDGRCNVQDMVGANNKIFGRPAYCSRYPLPSL